MQVFNMDELAKRENLEPGKYQRQDILTEKQRAIELGGLLGVIPPHSQRPYHYHHQRESLLIAVWGHATEIVDGQEIPFNPNTILFIAPGEKHTIVNRTDQDFVYLEFHTHPPVEADFVEVK